jgi:hypothetical protein
MLFGGGQVEAKVQFYYDDHVSLAKHSVRENMQAQLFNGSCGSRSPCVDGHANGPHAPRLCRSLAARGCSVW